LTVLGVAVVDAAEKFAAEGTSLEDVLRKTLKVITVSIT
jgi:hypothetical protein